jgi:hypothetical protein
VLWAEKWVEFQELAGRSRSGQMDDKCEEEGEASKRMRHWVAQGQAQTQARFLL